MSKKYLAMLVIPALIFAAALIALPKDAAASQLLGITITPTPTETETPTPTETESPTPSPTMTLTEEPDTPTPTPEQQRPTNTPRPQETEVVLLPETGEFPIDPAQGIQWLFALGMIFLIGLILIRTFRTARIKK